MVLAEESTKNLWLDIYNTGNLHYCFNCSTCVSGCPAVETVMEITRVIDI